MAYWLYKSEPSVYAFDDLVRDGRTEWEGVRNFLARNYLKAAKEGDLVLFYHSNAKPQARVRPLMPPPTMTTSWRTRFCCVNSVGATNG